MKYLVDSDWTSEFMLAVVTDDPSLTLSPHRTYAIITILHKMK